MALRLVSSLRYSLFLAPSLRQKIKPFNIPKDNYEEGDDILEPNFDKKDPMLDPPPGIRLQHDPIPSQFWYGMLGKVPMRPTQPGYCRYPVGSQTWHIFNASTIPLGRMASRIAALLSGRYKPTFDHSRICSEDEADFVVVVNGRYPLIHGKRAKLKIYYSHSTYPGGLHKRNICNVLGSNNFGNVVKDAVYGMLPHTNVRPFYMERLKVYPELLHDMKDIPQLLMRPHSNALSDLGMDKITSEGTLIYSSDPKNLPPQLQGLKYDPNDPALKPMDEDSMHIANFTKEELKVMRLYRKKLRRYRVFNYRTRKFEL